MKFAQSPSHHHAHHQSVAQVYNNVAAPTQSSTSTQMTAAAAAAAAMRHILGGGGGNNHHIASSPSSATSLTHQYGINSSPEKAPKRHYNSEVDPARYRKVLEEGITKFACSLCGNTYKWRKSLNKHWKEKHITETPPPLDAPVTIKLRNGELMFTSFPLYLYFTYVNNFII